MQYDSGLVAWWWWGGGGAEGTGKSQWGRGPSITPRGLSTLLIYNSTCNAILPCNRPPTLYVAHSRRSRHAWTTGSSGFRGSARALAAAKLRQLSCPLGGGSEADLRVAIVEDGVILAQEDIAEDPQRATRRGDIDAHDAEEAFTLNREDVIGGGEGKGLAADGEGKVGQLRRARALDGVLALDERRHDARGEGREKRGERCLGDGKERGARVGDGLGLGREGRAADGDGGDGELPVAADRDRRVRHSAGVLALVDAAERELSARRA